MPAQPPPDSACLDNVRMMLGCCPSVIIRFSAGLPAKVFRASSRVPLRPEIGNQIPQGMPGAQIANVGLFPMPDATAQEREAEAPNLERWSLRLT